MPKMRAVEWHAMTIMQLAKKPRTIDEMMALTGAAQEAVTDWLKALRDEGLVRHTPPRRVAGTRTAVAPGLWEWTGPL